MKKVGTFVVGCILAVLMIACEKSDNPYQSTGTITGPDYRECICCGGYFIAIDNDTTYNFESLPDGVKIDLNTAEFPIAVKLDWSLDRECGNTQYITISRLEKQ
ncbi:MAG TPA: hypothetical protein VKA27_18560 [Sunxiuqinia sp.]|nr:hypothetical protein [Sunxiuqinia sp.]